MHQKINGISGILVYKSIHGFLMKELYVKQNGLLSLQKHHHRSEHWLITQGIAKVTLDNKTFLMRTNEKIFIPQGSIHRIQNNYKTTFRNRNRL